MTESEKIACKELWPKAALTDESRHASPMDVDGSGFSGRNEIIMSIQIKSNHPRCMGMDGTCTSVVGLSLAMNTAVRP